MKKTILLIALGATLAGCATNRAKPPQQAVTRPPEAPSPSAASLAFLHAAMSSNQFEIESGQLALHYSRDPAVRSFAQNLVSDHHHLSTRIVMAAQSAGATPAPMLLPQHSALLAQLQGTPAAQFDEAFRNMQVMVHMQAIDAGQRYAATGDNPTLRSVASEMVPLLQAHLSAAQNLRLTPAPAYRPRPRPGERG